MKPEIIRVVKVTVDNEIYKRHGKKVSYIFADCFALRNRFCFRSLLVSRSFILEIYLSMKKSSTVNLKQFTNRHNSRN